MEEKQTDNQIIFYNKISPNFKEIHVDGAFGGVTPKGDMNLNFYAERLSDCQFAFLP